MDHYYLLKESVEKPLIDIQASLNKRVSVRRKSSFFGTSKEKDEKEPGRITDIVEETIQDKKTSKPIKVYRIFVTSSEGGEYNNIGWVHHAEVPNCMICGSSFGMMQKKLSCTCCGKVTCGTCNDRRSFLAELKTDKKVRTCKNCFRGTDTVSAMAVLGNSAISKPSAAGTASAVGPAGGATRPALTNRASTTIIGSIVKDDASASEAGRPNSARPAGPGVGPGGMTRSVTIALDQPSAGAGKAAGIAASGAAQGSPAKNPAIENISQQLSMMKYATSRSYPDIFQDYSNAQLGKAYVKRRLPPPGSLNMQPIVDTYLVTEIALETLYSDRMKTIAIQEPGYRIYVVSTVGGEYCSVGWMLLESIPCCMICAHTFNVSNRKYHCKTCGNVICLACSPLDAILDGYTELGPQKVCTACYQNQTFGQKVEVALPGGSGMKKEMMVVALKKVETESTSGKKVDEAMKRLLALTAAANGSGVIGVPVNGSGNGGGAASTTDGASAGNVTGTSAGEASGATATAAVSSAEAAGSSGPSSTATTGVAADPSAVTASAIVAASAAANKVAVVGQDEREKDIKKNPTTAATTTTVDVVDNNNKDSSHEENKGKVKVIEEETVKNDVVIENKPISSQPQEEKELAKEEVKQEKKKEEAPLPPTAQSAQPATTVKKDMVVVDDNNKAADKAYKDAANTIKAMVDTIAASEMAGSSSSFTTTATATTTNEQPTTKTAPTATVTTTTVATAEATQSQPLGSEEKKGATTAAPVAGTVPVAVTAATAKEPAVGGPTATAAVPTASSSVPTVTTPLQPVTTAAITTAPAPEKTTVVPDKATAAPVIPAATTPAPTVSTSNTKSVAAQPAAAAAVEVIVGKSQPATDLAVNADNAAKQANPPTAGPSAVTTTTAPNAVPVTTTISAIFPSVNPTEDGNKPDTQQPVPAVANQQQQQQQTQKQEAIKGGGTQPVPAATTTVAATVVAAPPPVPVAAAPLDDEDDDDEEEDNVTMTTGMDDQPAAPRAGDQANTRDSKVTAPKEQGGAPSTIFAPPPPPAVIAQQDPVDEKQQARQQQQQQEKQGGGALIADENGGEDGETQPSSSSGHVVMSFDEAKPSPAPFCSDYACVIS